MHLSVDSVRTIRNSANIANQSQKGEAMSSSPKGQSTLSNALPLQRGALLGAILSAAIIPAAAHADALDDEQSGSKEPIVVNGQRLEASNPNADPDAPYKVVKSQNDKFTEELKDTPKTVVAIPKEVIEDMGANSFREVVRSTPGVTLGTGEGGNAFGDRIFIRGFEARNDVYIDGLRDPGVTSREIFAVEQIEVIKGPSGSFGGRGTTGGLVSLESKRPQLNSNYTHIEAGIGTENYYRGTGDVNIGINDRIAIRVNGMYQNSDTPGRDFVTQEKYGGAIAAFWQLTDTLSVSADYYLARMQGIPDFGHPFDITTQRPYAVNGDNFYGVVGRDFIENGSDVATLRFDFDPIDDLSFRSVTRSGETYNNYLVGTPGAVCRVARTVTRACPTGGTNSPPTGVGVPVAENQYTTTAGGQRRYGTNRYFAHMMDATARFETGGIRHTLVLGGEYSNERVSTLPLLIDAFVEDANGNVIATPTTYVRNLLNPNPVLGFTIPVFANAANGPTKVSVESLSAYAIDTIKFTPQLWATLGARLDSYALRYQSNGLPTATILRNNVQFANYQASLTYKPSDFLTIYTSFATSSNPSGEQLDGNGIAYDGISAQTQNLEPERNRAWEGGVKWETPDGNLLVTAALFQITKANARENIGGNVYELVGKLRSRGAELGVNGTLFNVLQLFGGYTYTDAKIVESVTAANVGRQFANIPKHSANLLATVMLGDRVEVGGQVHYQSKFYGGTLAAGSSHVPGYVRLDAVARWKASDWLEGRVNVNNVTDKRYYDAIYRSGSPFAYVAPGRSAFVTLAVKM
jgi:catecholate siderophore receptor